MQHELPKMFVAEKEPLSLMLEKAKREERRARAEVMANRMVNLANHIKTNQLDINEALELLLQESEIYRHQAMEIH
jgi:ribosomal protein S15P/S13E